MGYLKDRQMEEMEQGWSFSDQTVCHRCLSDRFLREVVKETAGETECSFCERTSRRPIAIPFNKLMEVIAGAIFQYYDHVENESISYNSEDGRYIGKTFDTYDLVHFGYIPQPSERDDVMQEVVDCLGGNFWCEKQPYAITGVEQYTLSWEHFCKTVKHESRFFFGELREEDATSDITPVSAMLDELSGIIDGAGLITELPMGTKFFRIRAHKRNEVCDSWRSLGAPPPEYSVSNRMSAAGISMFYAGLDLATARAETTVNFDPAARKCLTAGTCANSRPLRVLDLSRLPDPPNFTSSFVIRETSCFSLWNSWKTLQPVAHDGREHIDYVPTQILTEYFRLRYKPHSGATFDGIIYPSARRKRGRSVVIFAGHKDLDPRPSEYWAPRTPILELDTASIRRVRRSRDRREGASR